MQEARAMEGNEFVWIASILVGFSVLGWLVMDWLASAQPWEAADEVQGGLTPGQMGRSEQQALDALDVELELMLSYPLDPFAPALLWRPLAQSEWAAETEEQFAAEKKAARRVADPASLLGTSEAGS
jgi:hypothetical protein